MDAFLICNQQLKMTSHPCPVQDKVRASMVKPEDPQDMQIRKLPSKGMSAAALRDKLKYKACSACHASAACCELQSLPSWQAAAVRHHASCAGAHSL